MESQLMSVSPCAQTVFCHRGKIQSKNERHQRHRNVEIACFTIPSLSDAPAQENPSEFLDET